MIKIFCDRHKNRELLGDTELTITTVGPMHLCDDCLKSYHEMERVVEQVALESREKWLNEYERHQV